MRRNFLKVILENCILDFWNSWEYLFILYFILFFNFTILYWFVEYLFFGYCFQNYAPWKQLPIIFLHPSSTLNWRQHLTTENFSKPSWMKFFLRNTIKDSTHKSSHLSQMWHVGRNTKQCVCFQFPCILCFSLYFWFHSHFIQAKFGQFLAERHWTSYFTFLWFAVLFLE